MKHLSCYSVSLLLLSICTVYSLSGSTTLRIGRKESFSFSLPVIKEEPVKRNCNKSTSTQGTQDICMPLGKNFMGIYFEENFDCAMIGTAKDIHEYQSFIIKTPDKKLIDIIKNQYAQYVKDLEHLYIQAPRIPKIIHQIWIGPHPFPQEARAWQETWLRLHPDWEYKLWTNEEVDALDFENKVYYNQAQNWGEKADILRYEILYKFGGMYADIDQSCLKPFDVLHHTCDFYTGIHAMPLITIKSNSKLRIANGVCGCCPGHPIMHQLVEHIKLERAHSSLLARTGPDYFTKIINQCLPSSLLAGNSDVIFPANYFYPCAKRKNSKFKIESTDQVSIKPETFGIQYYTSYWLTPPTN